VIALVEHQHAEANTWMNTSGYRIEKGRGICYITPIQYLGGRYISHPLMRGLRRFLDLCNFRF
jgi:hypothetical protein